MSARKRSVSKKPSSVTVHVKETYECLLPRNGSVVVIDDRMEEAEPLIKLLSARGVPVHYFNGILVPKELLRDVRIVFLDMVLGSTQTGPGHSIPRSLLSYLESVISPNAGPYIMLVWSTHQEEYYEEFCKIMDEEVAFPKPVFVAKLNKADVFEDDNLEIQDIVKDMLDQLNGSPAKIENYNSIKSEIDTALSRFCRRRVMKKDGDKLIESSIKVAMEAAGSIGFYYLWENTVNRAVANISNQIALINAPGKMNGSSMWIKNNSSLLQKLASANDGKSLTDPLRSAVQCMNEMLPDAVNSELKNFREEFTLPPIEHLVSGTFDGREHSLMIKKVNGKDEKYVCSEKDVQFQKDKSPDRELMSIYNSWNGKLNSKLLLQFDFERKNQPGSVYKVVDEEFKKQLLLDIYRENEVEGLMDRTELVYLEVTPSCDFAQCKSFGNRILPGILIKRAEEVKFVKKDNIDESPTICIEGVEYVILYNYKFYKVIPDGVMKADDIVFVLRSSYVSDLRSKLMHHGARAGIIFVRD